MTAQDKQDRADAIQTVQDAAREIGEFGERVGYGAIAFVSTAAILHIGFKVPPEHLPEPAILNAGIAYYTHAATGRIIRALRILAAPAARKVIPSRKSGK